jgi:hypothetical protein
MERSLPVVEYDRFPFEKWELTGKPEFILGGQRIETFPSFGGENTPPEGLRGLLNKGQGGFSLADSSTGKALARIWVSNYGKAITHHRVLA